MTQAVASRKDPMLAAVLGFFLGFFGIFYVSWKQAALGFGLFLVFFACTGGVAAPFVWMGFAVWGYIAATKHNENVEREARDAAEHAAAHAALHGRLPEHAWTDAPSAHVVATSHVGQSLSSVPIHAQSLPATPAPSSAASVMASACAECGAALRAGAKFCGACGTTQLQGGNS